MQLTPNIPDPDAFYEALIEANHGLSEHESHAYMIRLALLLANQIGDRAVLMDAIEEARQ